MRVIHRHEGLHAAPAFLPREKAVERRNEQRHADIAVLIGIDERLADRRVAKAVTRILDLVARFAVVRRPINEERIATISRGEESGGGPEGITMKIIGVR